MCSLRLREGKKVNGAFLYTSYSLHDFFFRYSSYGFSKKILILLQSRLETRLNKKIKEFSVSKMLVIYNILLSIVPCDRELKKKTIFNVFMLDLINSYRGLRHSFGLPTRGQRTWTNAWSTYKSNLMLRQFKIKLSKRLYTTITISDLNIAYLAEQINSLWKLQWEFEWKKAKRQRQLQAKKSRNFYKVDLRSIASGNVAIKKKQINSYIVGFDPGFTKYVIKQSLKFKSK